MERQDNAPGQDRAPNPRCVLDKPWFMDRVAPGLWVGGRAHEDDKAAGVTYRLTDLTEIAGVFCRCTQECRDTIRRIERLVDVRDDLRPDAAWDLVGKMWRQKGSAAPYDRKALVDLVASCRQKNTGKVLHALDEDGRAVAFALFVCDCNTAYYLLGSVDPDCKADGVDLLLAWRGIRALQGRVKAIDFGGPAGRSFGADKTPLDALRACPKTLEMPGLHSSPLQRKQRPAFDTGRRGHTTPVLGEAPRCVDAPELNKLASPGMCRSAPDGCSTTNCTISEQAMAPGRKSNGSIFYKARALDTGNMWDTWGYFHNGTYYLYCLANSSEIGWDNISLATSPDGVHWLERGPVIRRRPTSIWMGTGSTWKSPNFSRDGKFLMNFSASEGGMTQQTIFFAESTDLVHWKRLGDECEFKGGGRWYEPLGRWDCIFTVPRPGGGMYGYWTAQPRDRSRRFGFGQSDDGVRWEPLEAPEADCPADGEVGAVALLAGRYYMMYGTGGSMIMLTLVADRPGGPFLRARKNATLLSGHTYFTRFFEAPDGVLISHHCIARDGQVHAAPLTRAVVDAEGALRICWWPGNEKMKRLSVPLVAPDRSASPVAMLGNTFDAAGGVILEGTLDLPGAGSEALTGLYIECANNQAVAISLSSDGGVQVGPIGPDGTDFRPDKEANREVAFRNPVPFRLLLEHSLFQFYLDDILMEGYSLPADATGGIGLLGGASVRHAWKA